MCEPASFILTETNEYWSMKSDSHEDILAEHILAEHNLKDSFGGKPKILRVEITPPGGNFSAPLDQWRYRTDQDVMPDWFDESVDESRARRALVAWVAARVFTSGEHSVTEGRVWACNNATVRACNNATVRAFNNATVRAFNNAMVEAFNNAMVEAFNNATVIRWSSDSKIELHDLSVCVDRSKYGSVITRKARKK